MKPKAILDLVRERPDELDKRAIARELGIKGDDRRTLRATLRDMVENGELILSKGRKTYRVRGDLPPVTVVRIEAVDDSGDLTGRPETWRGEGEAPALRIREENTGRSGRRGKPASLGVGDRVLARIKTGGSSPVAVVMKKLPRTGDSHLGILRRGGRGWRIHPVSKKARDDFTVRDVPATISPDTPMLVRYRPAGRGRDTREAKITEVVDRADGPNVASEISLEEHGIPTEFPSEVIREAEAATMPEIGGPREDLRHLPLITIDPVDAKDFDDAVLAIPGDNGDWTVWVAIADVAAFVTPGSALDKEAEKRGNSVYLPDRVVPMLPHELSSDLCSLRPHEDRACMAVEMRFNRDGKKTSHRFHRGVMRSHARLTYRQAQEGFDGHPGEVAETVFPELRNLYAAYGTLLKGREKRAPLAIELPERRVHVNEDGDVTAITVRDRFDAHKLIEEFMVQANVCAAESLDRTNTTALQRVHEPPAFEKTQGLSEFLKTLDIKWSAGERPTTARFNDLLKRAEDMDMGESIGLSVLRTQSQAYYGPESDGHFGLNLSHYAHFTSPIRRYADLVVHRALIDAFNLGDDGLSKSQRTRLKEIGEHISSTERRAMAAERDAVDRYIAAWLSDQEGSTFEARISGVTKFGLFITLDDTGADGLILARELGDEFMVYDEKRQALVGQDTGGTYRLGQRIRAKLVEADATTGGMKFEMKSPPEKGKKPKGRGKGGRGRGDRGKRRRRR